MLMYGIATSIIRNIPAEYITNDLPVIPAQDNYKRVVDLIPALELMIDFNSDRWDLGPYQRIPRKGATIINFVKFNHGIKGYAKLYAAYLFDSMCIKPCTLRTRLNDLNRLINIALRLSGKSSPFQLYTEDIEAAAECIPEKHSYRVNCLSVLIQFTRFLEEYHSIYLMINVDRLLLLKKQSSIRLSCRKVQHHFPNIPEQLFDKMINLFNNTMRNEALPHIHRMIAGMMLLESQTGNRTAELPLYYKEPIKFVEVDDKMEPVLQYNCTKAARGKRDFVPQLTICTDIAFETVRYLQELRKKCSFAEDSQYLLAYDEPSRRQKLWAVDPDCIRRLYRKICKLYGGRIFNKEWEGISPVAVDGKKYYIPPFYSFRIHMMTSLKEQGFPLDFIECIASHTPQFFYDGYYQSHPTPAMRWKAEEYIDSFVDSDKLMEIILNYKQYENERTE